MQCEEWDDANSQLFKEFHDEAVHKNSYKSRLYELISASLASIPIHFPELTHSREPPNFYSYSFFYLRILQLCSPFFVTKNSDFHVNFPLCSRYQRRNRKCENAARQIHACNFTPHLSARKVTLATSRLAWSWKRFQSTLPAGGNDVPPLPCIK